MPLRGLLVAAAILLPAIGVGDRIAELLVGPARSRAERLAFAAALGLGAVGLGAAALGFLGMWTRPPALALLAALWLAGATRGVRVLRTMPTPRAVMTGLGPLGTAIAVLAALHLLSSFVVALGPPVHGDALMGYLAVPRLWIEGGGRMVEIPYTLFDDLPGLALSQHTWTLLIGPDVAVALVELTYTLLFGLATYVLACRFTSRGPALLAFAAVLMTPVAAVLGPSAKQDMAWAAFETAAIVAILRAGDGDGSLGRWLLLAGICSGLGLSIKYTSFYVFPANLALVLVALSRRKLMRPGPLVRAYLAYGGTAVALASMWYVRNVIWTGNPVYPSFVGLFPGPYLPSNAEELTTLTSLHGPVGFVLLPVLSSVTKLNAGLDPPLGPFWLAFAPAAALLPRDTRRRLAPLILYGLVVFVGWYAFRQRSRDFLPALAAFTVVAVAALAALRGAARPWMRTVAAGVVVLVFAVNLGVNGLGLRQPMRLRAAVGLADRGEFLAWAFPRGGSFAGPTYPAVQFMNEHLPKSAKVAALAGENRYYLEVQTFASNTASGEVERLFSSSGEEFARRARAGGYDYLFVNWPWANAEWKGDVLVSDDIEALSLENQHANLRRLYDDGRQAIFAIDPRPRRAYPVATNFSTGPRSR